jgi:hypothetical protein
MLEWYLCFQPRVLKWLATMLLPLILLLLLLGLLLGEAGWWAQSRG